MDENSVKEVLTGALSKVLNALQNAPGTGKSSQSSQRDEPSTSRSTWDDQVLLLRVTPPMIQIMISKNKGKRKGN